MSSIVSRLKRLESRVNSVKAVSRSTALEQWRNEAKQAIRAGKPLPVRPTPTGNNPPPVELTTLFERLRNEPDASN